MISTKRSRLEPVGLPPSALLACDFGGGYVLCYTTADGTEMFPCLGDASRKVDDILNRDSISFAPKTYILTTDDESMLLRRLADEANSYVFCCDPRKHITLILNRDIRMYVAMKGENPALLEICFLYREISSVIASRTGVNVP